MTAASESALTIVGVAIALLLGAWAALGLRRWFDRRQRVRRSRRAQDGEDRARSWLTQNGFVIRGEQESLFCDMQIDGRRVEYEVCVDFVVERDGQRGIVEVKTGTVARAESPATRRQIFEYAAVYGVDRVYMFDGDNSSLHEVVFRIAPSRLARVRRAAEWRVGFLCGVVVAAGVAVWVWVAR
jgi:hypothetical protein